MREPLKDLAIRTAEATGATYVLAQDPDADRFSAAERKYGDLMRLTLSSKRLWGFCKQA